MTETVEIEFYIGVDGHGCVSVSTDQDSIWNDLCSGEPSVIYAVAATVPVPQKTHAKLSLNPADSPTLTQQSARLKLPE